MFIIERMYPDYPYFRLYWENKHGSAFGAGTRTLKEGLTISDIVQLSKVAAEAVAQEYARKEPGNQR